MRTSATNLLLASKTAKTKFFVFEQFDWMAVMIESRMAGFSGNIRTECVRNTNGLLETE